MENAKYTVLEIEKTKKEKRLIDVYKWSSRAGAIYSLYTGLVIAASTGLGIISVGLFAGTFALWKLSSKTADLSFNKSGIIADLKSSITYEEYKKYHKKSIPIKAYDKVKTLIKNRHHGFAPSDSDKD